MIVEPWTPVSRVVARRDRAESECPNTMEHFSANLWVADVLAKLTGCAVIGALEDAEGGRISTASYRLSRSGGTGDWVRELEAALKAGAARNALPSAVGDWLADLSRFLIQTTKRADAEALDLTARPVFNLRCELVDALEPFRRPTPLALLRWCVEIRNKTIAHGALGSGFWAQHTDTLTSAVNYLIERLPLFAADLFVMVPTHKHQPCGRVLRGQEPAGTIRTDGLDIGTAGCQVGDHVWPLPALAWVRPSDNHTFVVNGSWRDSDRSAELLCHAIAAVDTGEGTLRRQLPAYAVPPVVTSAVSETEGAHTLDTSGSVMHNLPSAPDTYVRRASLENDLRRVLLDAAKRHLVNVKGIGGIGKTSLVLQLAHDLVAHEECPYAQIIWVSARDVDLTVRGPKPVRQAAGDIQQVWEMYARLLGDDLEGDAAKEMFEHDLADRACPTLLVMDNFETFVAQGDAYQYLDEVVQPPSKVVITSRHDFKGDFQVQVRGMETDEAAQLIRLAARRAGREGLIDPKVVARIYEKSQGHPYAMKLLATSVESKAGLANLLRDVFRDEGLLDALFRESIAGVDDEAEFVFLLASRFPAGVSEVALRVATAPEDIDLGPALQALRHRSLLEADEASSLYVMPAMAREFARRLSIGHIHGVGVDEAERYLKSWPGLVTGAVREAALEMQAAVLNEGISIRGRDTTTTLRLLGEYDDGAWVSLARALRHSGGSSEAIDDAYKRAVESTPGDSTLFNEWAASVEDPDRRIQLKVQAVTADPSNFKLASNVAQFLNHLRAKDRLRYSKLTWTSLMEPVAEVLNRNLRQLDANDCSRLAWLLLTLGDGGRAETVVRRGYSVDCENYNILNLVDRLSLDLNQTTTSNDP